jgi:prolyl 4-hydroxylase
MLQVFTYSKTDSKHTKQRVSKSAWLYDSEHCKIASLSRRMSLLTNLSLETAEALQVLNYGIGGHYEPHYDFSRPSKYVEDGNRIMTVLCYMTDVEAGGGTVFPKLGVRLMPSKGACAAWYNLRASGKPDNRTLHAGCPVLAGSKWVCNKWIHERGQEFNRSCSLDPDN